MPQPSARFRLAPLLVSALLACDDGGVSPMPILDPSLLTPEVAAQLDAAGRFPPQRPEAGYLSIRSVAQAEALIPAYLDEWFPSQGDVWSTRHGGRIDRAQLRRCGQVYYASSPYDVTAMSMAQPLRATLAGRYYFTFCGARGQPQLWIAVAVEAPLTTAGLDVIASGIPIELDAPYVISPEYAAQIAAGRTRRRVASVPELVISRFGWSFTPRWRIRLESPVIVDGWRTHERDTTDVVWVGFDEVDSNDLRPYALRGIRPAAAGLVDTIHYSSNPLDRYVVREGMPWTFEPFYISFPYDPFP